VVAIVRGADWAATGIIIGVVCATILAKVTQLQGSNLVTNQQQVAQRIDLSNLEVNCS
jgi:hypothetical protein